MTGCPACKNNRSGVERTFANTTAITALNLCMIRPRIWSSIFPLIVTRGIGPIGSAALPQSGITGIHFASPGAGFARIGCFAESLYASGGGRPNF
jgi:hypothetical protein